MIVASARSQYIRIRVEAVGIFLTSTDTKTKMRPHQTPVSFETAPMACLERGLFLMSAMRLKSQSFSSVYLPIMSNLCLPTRGTQFDYPQSNIEFIPFCGILMEKT